MRWIGSLTWIGRVGQLGSDLPGRAALLYSHPGCRCTLAGLWRCVYWPRFFTGHAVGLAAGDGGGGGDGAARFQGGSGPVSMACFLGMARLLRRRGGGPAGGCGFKDMARLEKIVVI